MNKGDEMHRKNPSSLPTKYLFICILLNLFLIIFAVNLNPDESWLVEITSILVLFSRGSIGIYLGWRWFSIVKRDIYPTDWIRGIIINGIFLVVVIFIVSVIVPNVDENVLLWPYSGVAFFLGTDMLLTLFIVFGDLFVGEGAFIMAIVIFSLSGFLSLGFPFFVFTLGVILARLKTKRKTDTYQQEIPESTKISSQMICTS